METKHPNGPKPSLWKAILPFTCLLPINTAFVILQDVTFPLLLDKNSKMIFGVLAIILSLAVGFKMFHIYKKVSLQRAIYRELILTGALIICRVFTEGFFRPFNVLFMKELSSVAFCFYSSIWPLLKLRYQLYLHQYSEASNQRFIYSLVILIQMLPNIIGRVIADSDLYHIHPLVFLIIAFVISLILYNNIPFPEEGPERGPRSAQEGQKALKEVLKNKECWYLLVICMFCGMNFNKANAFFISWSDNEFFSHDLSGPFYGSWKFLTICLIGRAFLIVSGGKLLDNFNKAKVLQIATTFSFIAMILLNYGLVKDETREFKIIMVSVLWGFSELVYLVVQVIISVEFKGRAELFFVCNAFFFFGDLMRRFVDPMKFGKDSMSLVWVYMIIQFVLLGLYLISLLIVKNRGDRVGFSSITRKSVGKIF